MKKFIAQQDVKKALKDISAGCEGAKSLLQAIEKDPALKNALVKELREMLGLKDACKDISDADAAAEIKRLMVLFNMKEDENKVREVCVRSVLVALAMTDVLVELNKQEGGLGIVADGLSKFAQEVEKTEKDFSQAAAAQSEVVGKQDAPVPATLGELTKENKN